MIKNSSVNAGNKRRGQLLGQKDSLEGMAPPPPVFLSGESSGQRSLVGAIVYRAAKSRHD